MKLVVLHVLPFTLHPKARVRIKKKGKGNGPVESKGGGVSHMLIPHLLMFRAHFQAWGCGKNEKTKKIKAGMHLLSLQGEALRVVCFHMVPHQTVSSQERIRVIK